MPTATQDKPTNAAPKQDPAKDADKPTNPAPAKDADGGTANPAGGGTVPTEPRPVVEPDWSALVATAKPVEPPKPAVKEMSEEDIPEALRGLVEKLVTGMNDDVSKRLALAIPVAPGDPLKSFLKYVRNYAKIRKAGRVTINAKYAEDTKTVTVSAIKFSSRGPNAAKPADAPADAPKSEGAPKSEEPKDNPVGTNA